MAILESRTQEKKSTYANATVTKISGGNLSNQKPIFCEKGRSLIVSCGEACHLYNASTGDHVKELFTCQTKIVTCQLHPSNSNFIIATTEDGEILVFDLLLSEIHKKIQLILNAKILQKHNTPKFNQNKEIWSWGDYDSKFKWNEHNLMGLENRKFIYSVTTQLNEVFCTWALVDEYQAHISVFCYKTGKHLNLFNMPNVALQKCYGNFGVGGFQDTKFFVGRGSNFVHVCKLSNQLKLVRGKRHLINKYIVTALAIDTQECSFATGDTQGKIYIWRNILLEHPLREMLHWHTLPVQDMAYSSYSSHLYSGGDENVLVKWSLNDTLRNFLPRLSGTIVRISVAPESNLLSISTADNRILVIDNDFKKVSVIQHFSKWPTLELKTDLSIFTVDPRTESFVLQGQTGHLQFLSSKEDGKLLYTLDVTNKNLVTRRRESEIINVQVTHARFSRSGKWLVTAESRDEVESGESRLKFWEYDEIKQTFTLNTNIELPHENWGINSLEMSSDEVVATTGRDKKFKLWASFESLNANKVIKFWSFNGVGTYRLLPCFATDFSKDSSLLAASFGPILTIWETNTCSFKCGLTPPLKRDDIKYTKFGNSELSHIVVTATESCLSAWNIITLSMLWTVPLKVTALASDPYTLYMCAFSSRKNLFIFNPSSASPEVSLENVSDSTVVSANFVFNHDVTHSQLYFLNSNQELFRLENANEKKTKAFSFETTKNFTPFTAQMAGTVKTDVSRPEKVRLAWKKMGSEHMQTILNSPAHTLPNPSLFCSEVLKSLLLASLSSSQSCLPESNGKDVLNKDGDSDDDDYHDNEVTEIVSTELVDSKATNNIVDEKELLKTFDSLFVN